MNIKELYKNLLKEFEVDQNGEPLKSSTNIEDIATKHGYTKYPHKFTDHRNSGYVVYQKPIKNGSMYKHQIVSHDNGLWTHYKAEEGKNDRMIANGNDSELDKLDQHLADFHK